MVRSGKALLRPYFIVNTAEKLLGPLNCDGLVVKSDPIPACFLRRLRHPLNKAGSKSRFHTEAVAKGSKKRSTTMKRNMNSLKRAFTPTMTLAVALAIAIVGLCAGLYVYMAFIQTAPQCALENHHGAGNCPVQLLRWYPTSKIEKW